MTDASYDLPTSGYLPTNLINIWNIMFFFFSLSLRFMTEDLIWSS